MTASQARLHVGGEAAIPFRSSQPCVDWGVSLRRPLSPQYPAPTAPSLWVSIWGLCPTGGAGGYLGFAAHARQARIQRSLPCVRVCIVAGQDLISGSVISHKLGNLSKRLFWGFKTTTGDGMI